MSDFAHDMIGREIRVGDLIGRPRNGDGDGSIETAIVTMIDQLRPTHVGVYGRLWYNPFEEWDEVADAPILAPFKVGVWAGEAVRLATAAQLESGEVKMINGEYRFTS